MGKDIQDFKIEGAGLSFEFSFRKPDGEPEGLAFGLGRVLHEGNPVWAQQASNNENAGPIEWTWIDLLDFLASSWDSISLEQSYPLFLSPTDPFELRNEARKRWSDLPSDVRIKEDDELCRYELRHDLARGMRGIDLPSIVLAPEGKTIWICTEEIRRQYPAYDVLGVLSKVGDLISKFVSGDRGSEALKNWKRRGSTSPDFLLEMRTGLPKIAREQLQKKRPPREFWEINPKAAHLETEIQAATRMTNGRLSLEEQLEVIEKIRRSPRVKTEKIDPVSSVAEAILRKHPDKSPFEQGYELASWFRTHLGYSDSVPVDSRAILNDWGVRVNEFKFRQRQLDAIACWGPNHGPEVFLNSQRGTRASTRQGQSSTLAHEICHLLVDRNASLPLSDVFLPKGSNSRAEQRANAFAAEFLLPRSAAATIIRTSPTITEAIEMMKRKFGVGRQLASWQIRRSLIWETLDPIERSIVEVSLSR